MLDDRIVGGPRDQSRQRPHRWVVSVEHGTRVNLRYFDSERSARNELELLVRLEAMRYPTQARRFNERATEIRDSQTITLPDGVTVRLSHGDPEAISSQIRKRRRTSR